MSGAQDVLDAVRPSIVRIHAYARSVDPMMPHEDGKAGPGGKGIGTGFIVDLDIPALRDMWVILTCAHVVAGCRHDKASIILPNWIEAERAAAILCMCPELDVAVLVMPRAPLAREIASKGGQPDAIIGCRIDLKGDLPRVGALVYAVGYPRGMLLTLTSGNYSAYQNSRIKHSAPIEPGSSGGPLFLTDLVGGRAQCVGLNSSGIPGSANAFAVPMAHVLPILRHMILRSLKPADMATARIYRLPGLGVRVQRGIGGPKQLAGGDANGAIVHHVFRGSAFRDDLCAGDVLKSVVVRQAGREEETVHEVDHLGEVQGPDRSLENQRLPLDEFVTCHDPLTTQFSFVFTRHESPTCLVADMDRDPGSTCPAPDTDRTAFQSLRDWRTGACRTTVDHYDANEYLIFMGMCFAPLRGNHIDHPAGSGAVSQMKLWELERDNVLVTHVFPGTTVYTQAAVRPGSVLRRVNGCRIRTIDDLRRAVVGAIRTGVSIHIETTTGKRILMDVARLRAEEATMAGDETYGTGTLDAAVREALDAPYRATYEEPETDLETDLKTDLETGDSADGEETGKDASEEFYGARNLGEVLERLTGPRNGPGWT